MFQRLTHLLLIVGILGVILTGCAAGEQATPAQPVEEAAVAPTDIPIVPTATPLPIEPVAPPTEVATSPTEAAPTTEAVPTTKATTAATTEPEAAAVSRTFRIVPEQSETTYEVAEEFFNRPVQFFSPIGKTQAIEGEFQLAVAGSQVGLQENQFVVDLRTLASDDSRRDQRIRDNWLESNTYPLAEFKATTIEDFPETVSEGQEVPFKISGDMTIREITQPQTFEVVAKLEGNTFTGTAVTNLLMKDYGFDPPSILGMLQVTDGVTVTVKFTAEEVQPAP